MNRHRIQILQDAGLEEDLKKLPWEAGCRRPYDGRVRFGLSDGFANCQCQGCVLVGVRFWIPEIAVRLIPDFPEDMFAIEMLSSAGRPAGEGGNTLRVLRRACDGPGFSGERMCVRDHWFVKVM